MKISPTLIILLLLSLFFASAAWSGSVYRWVDEDGNVQFSSSPPSGQAAEETRYRTGADRSRQAPTAAEQDQPTTGEQEDADVDETATEAGPDMDALAEHHAQNCEQARKNLETIETNPRLRIEEDGEQRFLTPEEIAEHRAEAEAVKEESCNWSPEQESE